MGKLVGTAKPQQPRLLRIGTSLLLAEGVVRIWDATCMKALQKDVDDKEAERETLLYNANLLNIYAVRALLMSPMKEETTKLTWKLLARMTMWKKLHSLPRDTEVWTTRPANVKIEGGQVLPVAGAS